VEVPDPVDEDEQLLAPIATNASTAVVTSKDQPERIKELLADLGANDSLNLLSV
jgi:hypothetical protein